MRIHLYHSIFDKSSRTMILLDVKDLCKTKPHRIILDQISFQQKKLQKIAITGESGSGKSSLLKIIAGLLQKDTGEVSFYGEKVAGPEEKLMAGHPEIAYLSQHYELNNNYIVKDLIWFRMKVSDAEATNIFDICRINHLLEHKTNLLSGGEKQRIALCMLLVKSPKLLILDEPFSNLDPINKNILKTVLEELTARLKITCLLASHDPQDTLSWAEKIIVLKEGSIVQEGIPSQIYYEPADQYVAGIFGKFNLLSSRQAAVFGFQTKNDLMLRPENFRINNNHLGIKGRIEKISFWGPYYELDILIEEYIIVSRTMQNKWTTGQEIYVDYFK